MRKNFIKQITAVFVFSLVVLYSFLGESREKPNYTMSLSESVIAPGRQTRLLMSFFSEVDIPQPEVPYVKGLDVRYMGRSVGASGELVHTYRVAALEEGKYTIGPVSFSRGTETYVLEAVELVVSLDKVSDASLDVKKTGTTDDIVDRIFIEVDLPDRPLYVNETIPINIKLYSDWLDVENIVITDEPSKNYISGEYVSGNTGIMPIRGINFAVLEYKRDLFLPQPGDYTFGPVRASFDITKKKDTPLNNNENFYNNLLGRLSEKKVNIESDVYPLKVLNVPREGMPSEFTGALGKFELVCEPRYSEDLKVGDTVILESEITGKGSLTSKTGPVLARTEGFDITDQQARKTEKGLWARYQMKVIDPKPKTLPDVVFAYFDPEAGKYVSLRWPGNPVNIVSASLSEGQQDNTTNTQAEQVIEDPIVGIKKHPGRPFRRDIFFYKGKWVKFFLLLPLLFVAIASGIKKRIDILNSDTPYARRIRAAARAASKMGEIRHLLKTGKADAFYAALSAVLREYLGIRFLIPEKYVTKHTVDKYVRPALNDDELVIKINGVLEDVSFARFSTLVYEKKDMVGAFRDLKKIIDNLNRRKLS